MAGPGTIAIVPGELLPDLTARSPICLPLNNWWNLDLTQAPLDPNSSTIIETIRTYLGASATGKLRTSFGADFGIPYCGVLSAQQLVTVRIDRGPTESDPGPQGWTAEGSGWRESKYPIPIEAQGNLTANLRYIENGPNFLNDGDRHILVVDVDNWILYEFAYAHWQTDSYGNGSYPGKWGAGYAAVFDLKKNLRRRENDTSTDAAGLAVLPGLIRIDELLGQWPIDHAIRFAVTQAVPQHFYPASHHPKPTPPQPAGMPMGLRLRMKPGINFGARGITNQYSLKLFTAMQTYGILLADRCGSSNNMMFQGTLDYRWNDNGLFATIDGDMRKMFVTDFEVIQKGWNPVLWRDAGAGIKPPVDPTIG